MGNEAEYLKPEVVDATAICASFPSAPPREIPRDNILYLIEEMLGGDVQIVSIEGKEETGKTTVLSQFARRHGHATLSVFVRLGSRFSYDPEIVIRDLCNQAHWILNRDQLQDDDEADEARFRRLTYDLQRRARQTNRRFFFVVDGLENLGEDYHHVRNSVLELLPLESPQFKFVITGSYDAVNKLVGRKVGIKAFPLPGFIIDETIRYFEGTSLTREAINEIDRTFRGVPGRLASVRRILESGISSSELLEDLTVKAAGLFQLEWKNLRTDSKELLQVLALVAHDRNTHSLANIGNMLGADVNIVRPLLSSLDVPPEN